MVNKLSLANDLLSTKRLACYSGHHCTRYIKVLHFLHSSVILQARITFVQSVTFTVSTQKARFRHDIPEESNDTLLMISSRVAPPSSRRWLPRSYDSFLSQFIAWFTDILDFLLIKWGVWHWKIVWCSGSSIFDEEINCFRFFLDLFCGKGEGRAQAEDCSAVQSGYYNLVAPTPLHTHQFFFCSRGWRGNTFLVPWLGIWWTHWGIFCTKK